MKFLFGTLFALTALSSFAQRVDKIDLILVSNYGGGGNPIVNHLAKVEITRARYDRMIAENLWLICKTNTDQELSYLLNKGQLGVRHPKGHTRTATCSGIGCQTSQFEDLADIKTEALNSVMRGRYDGHNYGFFSVAFYEKYKSIYKYENFPNHEDIPYLTIYDPQIHGEDLPVTDTFYCAMATAKGEMVSP